MFIIVLQTIAGKRYIRKAIHAFTPAFIFTKMHLINIVLVPLNSSKINIYFNITVTNQSLFVFAFSCEIDCNMDTDKQRNQI